VTLRDVSERQARMEATVDSMATRLDGLEKAMAELLALAKNDRDNLQL